MKQKLKICTHHLRIEGKSLYNPHKKPTKDEKVPVDVSSLKWKKKDDDDKREGKMHKGLFIS